MQKNGVTMKRRNSLEIIPLKPKFRSSRNIRPIETRVSFIFSIDAFYFFFCVAERD